MKLKELKSILFSQCGRVQFAIVYDEQTGQDVETGCSVDYAVKEYGDRIVKRIGAYGDQLLIAV